MTEKYIENKLCTQVKARGGMAIKLVSPSMAGLPDRLVLLPVGKALFVELKATGKKMRALQVKRKRQLEGLGFLVYCIDDVKQIYKILNEGGDAK
ncbi:MAG: VRR-NUC domain-containing protein [Ruminiclostridium sp.]|nr:VRR-NUC domain-containing protein [Ruminiclostridium sp.]